MKLRLHLSLEIDTDTQHATIVNQTVAPTPTRMCLGICGGLPLPIDKPKVKYHSQNCFLASMNRARSLERQRSLR